MLTADIDVDRSLVAPRHEDGKPELTLFTTPLPTVEATPAAHLIPPPGAKAETALKQTAEIITSLTNTNSYIHIDFPDVISICASAAIRIIRFNAGDDPSKAFSDALAAQGALRRDQPWRRDANARADAGRAGCAQRGAARSRAAEAIPLQRRCCDTKSTRAGRPRCRPRCNGHG